MSFDEFCSEISIHIGNYLPDYNIEAVKVEKVTKNNGVECTGVVIILEGENVSPNIYLDYYYMVYKQGKSLDDILTMISQEYVRARETMENTNYNIDIDEMKDNIVIKLVNFKRNKDKLLECPYIEYLDLAITFRFLVKFDDRGVASALVSNKDLDRWNMTKEELYDIAKENTRRLFPEKFRCMDEIIQNMDELCIDIDDRKKLHVLTNESGINGATCVLYDGVLREFAKKMESSLYIIPSSIHEVIIICSCDVDKEHLKRLVKEINKFIVSELEFMSDNVYFYDLETDKIAI